MPTPAPSRSTPSEATLELLWHEDASAFALVREPDGTVSARGLDVGMPAVADIAHAGHAVSARRLELDELLALAAAPPTGLAHGGTARVTFALLDAARRSVAAGLVHPHLEPADGRWHALWGATLDGQVRSELDAIALAAPAACADPFGGDPDAFVYDLYGCAVDELARRALRDAGVTLRTDGPKPAGAAERFLAGLAAPGPELPTDSGYASLERRLNAWVDAGLARRSRAPWNLGLRLDEGEAASGGDAPAPVVLEAWLEAADDRAWPCRQACCARAPRRCSPSCARATRAGRSTAGSRRSSRSSRTPGSACAATRLRPPSSTRTSCGRSCATRCRGSRSWAFPSGCRGPGSRRRRGCRSTSSPRVLPRRPAGS